MVKKLFVILILCVLIRVFIGEPYYITSESMEPTLGFGDWIWVNKLSYGPQLPKRFADIPLLNVFTWIKPLRLKDEKNNWDNRRMPGIVHPAIKDIIVFRNPQDKNALLVKRIVGIYERNGSLYYEVRGDNRNNSIDSRSFGKIPECDIIGRVNYILLSSKDICRTFEYN